MKKIYPEKYTTAKLLGITPKNFVPVYLPILTSLIVFIIGAAVFLVTKNAGLFKIIFGLSGLIFALSGIGQIKMKEVPGFPVLRGACAVIFGIFFLLLFILLLSMAIYSDRIMGVFDKQPIEPIASGDFPASPIWVFSAEGDIISSPRGINQTMFARTNNFLYSIDISRKAINWKRASVNTRELVVPPLIIDPLVIVEENGSSLAAYSIDMGELIWKTPEIEVATVNNLTATIESMAVNKLFLYAARFDWRLIAYDLKTGETIWERDLPGRTHPYIAANEKIVILAADNSVSVLDATTGAVLWQTDTLGYAGPILLNGMQLFVTDEKNITLTAIDLETYQVDWVADYSSIIGDFEYSCLTDVGQNLLIAASKLIMVSKADGEIIWNSESMGTLECPAILGNNLYARNTGNDLFLIDPASGNLRGKLLVQEDTFRHHEHFRSPIVLGDWVIVPFGDDRIFIYQ